MIRLNNRGRFNDVSALILRSQTITKNVFHSVFLHIPFFSHTFCFWLPKIDLERNTIISRSWIGVEKAGNHVSSSVAQKPKLIPSSIVKSSSITDGARWMKTEHEWISSSVSRYRVRFPEIDGRSSSVDISSSMDLNRARLPRKLIWSKKLTTALEERLLLTQGRPVGQRTTSNEP